jgi:hypothetical protein
VVPVCVYGNHSWTIINNIDKQLEAKELWFLRRRMIRLSWTISKDAIWNKVNEEEDQRREKEQINSYRI